MLFYSLNMTARKNESQVNLLPEKGFASTTTGRILTWILSTFRVIVILTELVVVAAFFSRFWLDAQNTDLTEEIEQKKIIISSSGAFEDEFRDVQNRLIVYENFSKNKEVVQEKLESIRINIPEDVLTESILFETDKIQITGRSASEQSIQQYIVNLEESGLFENVMLSNVGARENDTALLFTIIIPVEGKIEGESET